MQPHQQLQLDYEQRRHLNKQKVFIYNLLLEIAEFNHLTYNYNQTMTLNRDDNDRKQLLKMEERLFARLDTEERIKRYVYDDKGAIVYNMELELSDIDCPEKNINKFNKLQPIIIVDDENDRDNVSRRYKYYFRYVDKYVDENVEE